MFGSQKLGREGRGGGCREQEVDRGAGQVTGQGISMTVCLGERLQRMQEEGDGEFVDRV